MKISMFHLMPHRELPSDFEQRYHSVWVDPPWWELADAERVGQYYNWTLDELTYAAGAGLDGVCVNEHHQNAYGFMPGPNLMGSALARATDGQDVAIVQMGATLPTTNPPIRVAEEYGMLDCISGGRLVAGMPLGSSMDANLCYGIPPIEHRDRYYEAHDLIMKSWQAEEMFAWNGKYYQLPMVNLWPRPIQKPHPPVWVPGSGSLSTWDFSVRHNHCYCFLSYWGNNLGKRVMDGFWEFVDAKGLEPNPYRAGSSSSLSWANPMLKRRKTTTSTSAISMTSPCTSPLSSSPLQATPTSAAWITRTGKATWTRSRPSLRI